MSDLNDQLRRYIDGLEEPVTVDEAMNRRADRRFRVPAAVLAGAAIVLIPAMVLVGLRWLPGGHEVVDTTAAPVTSTIVVDTTTTVVETTTAPPAMVTVPDLFGLDEAQARSVLEEIGLDLEVTEHHPSRSGFGLITAQGPLPGETLESGEQVRVGVRVRAECLDHESDMEGARSTTVQIFFECAAEGFYPDFSTPMTRVVALTDDTIGATLRELLAGPTDEERQMGFSSSFSAVSADALNGVTVNLSVPSRHVVDFNDAIMLDNISTSHASMYFLAELQANMFQFPEVDSVEFQRNGSCDAFWGMLERECQIVTRAEWEAQVTAWDAERALQPEPGEQLTADDVVGKTFTTQVRNDSPEIMTVRDGDVTDVFSSGFSEIGGWLLDDANTDDLKNWALHVTGHNAEMIWLVESIGHTDQGSMIYTVRAVLEIPWREIEEVMQGDPFVRDGASACTRNGVSDPRLVVVAEVSEADGVISDYMNPLLAWLINIDDARFVEIPVDGVECLFDLS